MISFKNSATALRLTFTILMLSLGSLTAMTAPLPQEDDDEIRRLWNMRFQKARAKAKKTTPAPVASPANQSAPPTSAGATPVPSGAAPTAPQASAARNERTEASPSVQEAGADDELVGLTIWRLRKATEKDSRDMPRLIVQKAGEFLAERIGADTPWRDGERRRLGIEVPREGASYIYVIDREVYADGAIGEPYLIFPAQSTPRGDEVGGAGKITYVPSRNDPNPFFFLERSRADQVSELLTIIISPRPLDLTPGNGPLRLDPAQVANWEKEWGGGAERRESRGSEGRGWTVAEKEAGEGTRKLVQDDPLPHIIYRVKANPGKPALIKVPLLINAAPSRDGSNPK